MKGKKYWKQIDVAMDLREAGKIQESMAAFSKMFKDIPANDIRALALVGSLFREANELSNSLYCFEIAVKSDPLSPRASLGLFHGLWRSERYDEAFDELDRFLAISGSEAHSRLLNEMTDALHET